MNPPSDTPWVTLRNCVSLSEADLFRSVLEAAGIQTYIPDETLLSAGSASNNLVVLGLGVQQIRLQVHQDDLNSADDLLKSSDTKATTG
jgi:hypothetical protein